ncbi:hypothetical protein EPH95_15905 [Salicibibacter halophilus]|uniref:Uncharacterized protein n=1 Tax=Salicibibacter halophilus TaxID=2502791 RepID=A0A514LKV0_9BACI|nr:hypothetical protein [Salicibibacter halophilus]QDI92490.1 hypothetical protein EPH95_15905 [Salicibibacter halophilus]
MTSVVVENGGAFKKELMRLNCHDETDNIRQQIMDHASQANDGEAIQAEVVFEMNEEKRRYVFSFLVTDPEDEHEDTGENRKVLIYKDYDLEVLKG